MALILLDGCEDFSSWTPSGAAAWSIAAGRNGNGFSCLASSTNWIQYDLQAAERSDTLTIGFAYRATITSLMNVVQFLGDAGATQHNTISIDIFNGQLKVGRGAFASPTNVYTANVGLTTNTWYYIECTVKLSDTVGTATFRVNGAVVGTPGTALDTKNAGTGTTYDQVRLYGQSSGGINLLDDIYIANDATTLLGDCKIETLYANGNGSTNAWTGSDGDSTNNYLLVDEVGTPDTTDYVFSSTAGQQDLYTMTDLAAGTGSVRAVCHAAHAMKTDSGARQIKLLGRGSATNGSGACDLTTAFVNRHWALTINPETGSPFTRAEVNALQSGVETV